MFGGGRHLDAAVRHVVTSNAMAGRESGDQPVDRLPQDVFVPLKRLVVDGEHQRACRFADVVAARTEGADPRVVGVKPGQGIGGADDGELQRCDQALSAAVNLDRDVARLDPRRPGRARQLPRN